MLMKEFDDLPKNDQRRLVKMSTEGLSDNVVKPARASGYCIL